MNKDRMLILADAIDNHSIADLGFNMNYVIIDLKYLEPIKDCKDYSGHNCNSIACIAGWASKVFEKERNRRSSTVHQGFAKQILELNEDEAYSLFFNKNHYPEKFITLNNHQAAQMLRECVKQDKIITWDEFFNINGI